jgi:hypothetical protein
MGVEKKKERKNNPKKQATGFLLHGSLYVNLPFLYYVYKITHIIKGRKRKKRGLIHRSKYIKTTSQLLRLCSAGKRISRMLKVVCCAAIDVGGGRVCPSPSLEP